MQRFFVFPDSIQGENATLSPDLAHQIRSVLRLKVGDQIILLDNAGWQYSAELIQVERHSAQARIISRHAAPPEPTIKITLYQALPKRDKFEWILQKCTEIGVSHFVPTLTARSIPDQISANKQERWARIISEAAEQSGRGGLPTLAEPQTFAEALAAISRYDLALIPYEAEQQTRLQDLLRQRNKPITNLALFIGAEGGFTADEISTARAMNVQPITLGARILRAETAAIVASALCLYELEGL